MTGYLNNEFKVFDHYHKEYIDKLDITSANFAWHVNELKTYQEVLQWYIEFNSGGTIHTEPELSKVKLMLQNNIQYIQPDISTLKEYAKLDTRDIFKKVK